MLRRILDTALKRISELKDTWKENILLKLKETERWFKMILEIYRQYI